MNPGAVSTAADEVLSGGGEMGARMRAIDWSKTTLGPTSAWPQSLRTCVRIILTSRQPMFVWWGDDLINLYNDAYKTIVGGKHPQALGQPASVVWKEIWDQVGPRAQSAIRANEGTYDEALLLIMERHGYQEETYYTFSYSPVPNDRGGAGGILCANTDDTQRIIDERQLGLLRELAARTSSSRTLEAACALTATGLATSPKDIPFALLYLVEPGESSLRLASTTRLNPGHPAAPERVGLGIPSPWPFAEVLKVPEPRLVTVDASWGALPAGEWPRPPSEAVLLPIQGPGQKGNAGVLVVGLNPFRRFDERYQGFLKLIAGQVSASIGNAQAYEDERRRAEALAELDRAKTAFFSNVSHEFRTPLTLMLGPLEDGLADAEAPLPPRQRERQELIRRNGLRLQKLVNTLLDFARIEAGRAQASFVPTDLSALTRDLASSFSSVTDHVGLSLVMELPDLPAPVFVDPSLWEKVVLNLLSNAFKFTFKGEIRIALKWLGDQVELSVQDTGTGIPEDELPRIFERFHRVEGARGRSHEGSGIGLALVQELVKLHGGAVDVTSTLGKGTTFFVRVPAGSDHLPKNQVASRTLTSTGLGAGAFLAEISQWNEPENGPPLPTAAAVNDLAGALPPMAPGAVTASAPVRARILVADDNTDMRQYLARLLSRHWTVDVVSDGAQALASVRANPPDLLLSDVMMPGMTGLELVQALRADERTRTLPVMLLSARAGEEATVEGVASGADEYLVKPFSANELLARVKAQLSISRLRAQAVRKERDHAEQALRLLEEAERATRSREEALAIVSHDLRSPLSAIYSATDVLARMTDSATVQKQADTIRRSAVRMNRLVGDLLDLASIDSGKLALELQPHNIDDLVREAVEMFDGRVVTEVAPRLPLLVCDKGRILQVLGNLISNAVKHTPPAQEIRVEAVQEGGSIRFSVTDRGPGVPVEMQPHIFDRYWHAAQKRRDGHGLGLSIAKGIVEGHRGQLTLRSTPGEGATFSFTLPTAATALGISSAESQPVAAAAPPPGVSFLPTAAVGDVGKLIEKKDWAHTPLGPFGAWPRSLRNYLRMILELPTPAILFWGPQQLQLYNDGYAVIMGPRHPKYLGAPFRECWPEAYATIQPWMQRVLQSGEAVEVNRSLIPLRRYGFTDEAYFTFSFSLVWDDQESISGVLQIVTEVTDAVLAERRTRALHELSSQTADAKSLEEAITEAMRLLAENAADLPFTLLYLVDPKDGQQLSLVGSTGWPEQTLPFPKSLTVQAEPDASFVGEVSRAVQRRSAVTMESLIARFGHLPGGAWPEPPRAAVVLPVLAPDQQSVAGVLVCGISPRLRLDDGYQEFLDLLSAHLTTMVGAATAYEAEKERSEALAEVDDARAAFFSNVSHELRTPLTLILGPVEDALATTTKTLEGAKLELVRRNALRLYKMVNTLLDFSGMKMDRALVEEDLRWSSTDPPLSMHSDAADGETDEAALELGSARILLVDGDPDLRGYVAGLLSTAFANVETANNGKDALKRALAHPPDLLIADAMMPGLDGLELVRALRNHERTRATPILLLTTRAGGESPVEGVSTGADDYLIKPFAARELLARVRNQLRMSRLRKDVIRHELAEHQLRETARSRDEWLAVVSHELRTPMSALVLSVQSLLRGGFSEVKVQTVEKHLHRAMNQIEQLVDVAALLSGELELRRQRLDLAELVRQVVSDLRDRSERLGCAVTVNDAPAVGRFDEPRVRHLVTSLLDNALKFGAQGTVEVSVGMESGQAVIRIVDHGRGINPEDEARVFGRFERAVPTRNFGGFGLGLWMARLTAEAHGGSVVHERTEGGGATFTVRLPSGT